MNYSALQQLSAEQTQAVAVRILSEKAYHKIEEDGGVVGEISQGAFNRFGHFLAWFGELAADSPGLYWLMVLGLWLVLGLIVFQVCWTCRQAFLKSSVPMAFDARDTQVHAEKELQKKLSAAIQEGFLTEALSLHFRLVLVRMAKLYPGRLRPGMTNRECLVAWDDKPVVQQQLEKVVLLLDTKWYAREECAADEFLLAERIMEEME